MSGVEAVRLARTMDTQAVGDLVHLSARSAVAGYFDSRNYRVLRRLLVFTTPVALVLPGVVIDNGDLWAGLTWLPLLLVTLWIFFTRSAPFFERYGRQMTMLYFAVLAAATALSIPEPEAAYFFAGYVIPALLLLFRFNPMEHLALAGVYAAAMGSSLLRPGGPEETGAKIGMAVASLVAMAIILAVAISATRRKKHSFLHRWRGEVARERDRSRMRTELEDAREIQLSMLPVESPALDWVDFASVSLPASEVGGDYFDYFELSGSRLAIVIGDVAGHGVASGLVLSGVRSSLHLLKQELGTPVEVLRKLDDMLRQTVGGRNFVTFQIAVLDPQRGRITVANAGHPPLFLVSASGRMSRLGGNSLPLGTRLASEYVEQEEPLAKGDTLLLFSDGAPEVRDLHGTDFGEGRLRAELARVGLADGARRVRDSLLNALSRFKGDVEQEDDLTLVVVKVGTSSGLV